MLTKKLFFFLLVCFAMTSCNKEDTLPADNITIDNTTIDNSRLTGANIRTPATSVDINERPGGPPNPFVVVSGASSKLNRNANGITINFKTNGLIPGNAYTLWWIVFDNPSIPGPPTLNTAAVGHIVGRSGKGNFSAHLSPEPGFTNPLTAEVHVILRSHGPAQPGMIPSQIHNWDLACDPLLTAPTGPGRIYSDSDEIGSCIDVQVAVHPGN